jgi:hypothetical protein
MIGPPDESHWQQRRDGHARINVLRPFTPTGFVQLQSSGSRAKHTQMVSFLFLQ